MARELASAQAVPTLYKALTGWLLHFYRLGFHLESERFPLRARLKQAWMEPQKTGRGVAITYELKPEYLWLVPAAIAIGFMLWMLWNLHREIKR